MLYVNGVRVTAVLGADLVTVRSTLAACAGVANRQRADNMHASKPRPCVERAGSGWAVMRVLTLPSLHFSINSPFMG